MPFLRILFYGLCLYTAKRWYNHSIRAHWSESAIEGSICATYNITEHLKIDACLKASLPLTRNTNEEKNTKQTTTKNEAKLMNPNHIKTNLTVAALSLALVWGTEFQIQTNVF
uniref:Uncharacterized protein n=1 Tax=Vibrio parahaemolyticus TaxID=670 RepID=A0A1B1LS20_VIBPH|nr:hypothetical protein [Vibrio parahaemolyticus]